MDSVHKFNMYNDERDKIFRIVQYAAHLLWAFQEKTPKNSELVLKFKEIESLIIFSRQALRFGKFIEAFNFSLYSMRLQDNLLRTTLTLSRISFALYLLCDNILWLSRIGLIKINEERFKKLANSYFLYSSVLSLTKNLYQFQLIQQNNIRMLSNYDRQDEEPRIHNLVLKNKTLILDMIKNICDILICLDSLNKFRLTSVKIGFLGMISSIIFIMKKN